MTQFDQDILAALLSGLIASCCFVLSIIGSPKSRTWQSIPLDIRIALFVCGGAFMVRSVNLLTLAEGTTPAPGHINGEGLILAVVIAYIMVAITIRAVSRVMPPATRERLENVEKQILRDPTLVPVAVPTRATMSRPGRALR